MTLAPSYPEQDVGQPEEDSNRRARYLYAPLPAVVNLLVLLVYVAMTTWVLNIVEEPDAPSSSLFVAVFPALLWIGLVTSLVSTLATAIPLLWCFVEACRREPHAAFATVLWGLGLVCGVLAFIWSFVQVEALLGGP